MFGKKRNEPPAVTVDPTFPSLSVYASVTGGLFGGSDAWRVVQIKDKNGSGAAGR